MGCDVHCASCIVDVTATATICDVGTPLACASTLFSGAVLICADYPDCYDCVS
jgi:hypothetical protein